MRALLIPERELSGELRVLVDARLDLLRPVDEARFGEVVDDRGAVMRAVAARAIQPIRLLRLRGVKGRISTNSRPPLAPAGWAAS